MISPTYSAQGSQSPGGPPSRTWMQQWCSEKLGENGSGWPPPAPQAVDGVCSEPQGGDLGPAM